MQKQFVLFSSIERSSIPTQCIIAFLEIGCHFKRAIFTIFGLGLMLKKSSGSTQNVYSVILLFLLKILCVYNT